MNLIYRVVWNASLGMMQAVSELACAHGGKSRTTKVFPRGTVLGGWRGRRHRIHQPWKRRRWRHGI
jgi:hypothetical protein